MNDPSRPLSSEQVWEKGWEGHERAQQLRLARLSFAEKLSWLEEAQKVVSQLQQNAGQADKPASTGK